MENKMDSLFKKKLEEHSLPPREEAWARVETNLPKKNNVIAWRIAAAILVAGALIAAGVFILQKKDTQILAEKSTNKLKPTSDSVDVKNNLSHKDAETQSKKAEEKNLHALASPRKRKQENVVQKNSEANGVIAENKSEEKNLSTSALDPDSNRVSRETIVEQNLKTDATAVVKTTSTPIEKPIKLEFTLEEVEADQTAVAKTETKNSGLKKMLETVSQMKNGEGPVNQLLEKKDELFALNFKKEKQKNQH